MKSQAQIEAAIDALRHVLGGFIADGLTKDGALGLLRQMDEAWNAPAPQEDVPEHGARLGVSSTPVCPVPHEEPREGSEAGYNCPTDL